MDYTPTSPIILARWVWWLTGSTMASKFFSMWRGEDLGTACTYVRSRAVALSYAVYALRVRERLGRQDPSPLESKSIRPYSGSAGTRCQGCEIASEYGVWICFGDRAGRSMLQLPWRISRLLQAFPQVVGPRDEETKRKMESRSDKFAEPIGGRTERAFLKRPRCRERRSPHGQ